MITKLILKNYTPLAKKGVTFIELNTEDVFNIILGRNGFGKTSLLRELSAFPPDNADYLPGGYKETHHKVGKDTYILTSSTGKSSEHHFSHNGKELNEGNTLLVQRELVKTHFGISNGTKNIITGLDVRDLFTTLSATRRKEFLMAINPNDTSYALKVYDKLKSNLNSLKGGLKTQRQRLVVEESRLQQLAAMDPVKLQADIRLLDDQIKNALIIHGTLQHVKQKDIVPIKTEISDILSFLIGNNTLVKHTKHSLLAQKEHSYGSLDRYKHLEVRMGTVLSEVSSQLSGLDMANNNLDNYRDRLQLNLTAINIHTDELRLVESKYDNHELFKGVYDNPDFQDSSNELISFLHGINRTTDKNISSDSYRKRQTTLKELEDEETVLKRKIDDIEHTLNHYKRADNVDCPKCNHKFKVGFNNVDPVKLEGTNLVLQDRKGVVQKEIKVISEWLEANEGWYESMGALTRYARRFYNPQLIISLISEYRIGRGDISILIDLVRNTTVYADVKKTLDVLKEETETVEKQIKFLESSDIASLFKRAEYVERELASTQRSIQRVLRDIRDIDDQLEIIELDVQKRDRLAIIIGELEQKLIENGQYRIKARVETVISELTPRKDQLISNLIRSESLNSVIQSIKDNITDMERREKHTQLLMDSLSPSKGLIGYLMNDFLKSVVANVNAIIQPIWTNRLHVMNCSTSKSDDDVDLNYNFPVLSGGSDKPNKDIGDCSGGEREIINFAFRLVLRRYLGDRCSLPLMMDEVGVAFDELHRGRFCAYIAEQARLDKLPQVFMISHYVNQYGVFNNSNVIALNTEGLTVPVTVNGKSVIK